MKRTVVREWEARLIGLMKLGEVMTFNDGSVEVQREYLEALWRGSNGWRCAVLESVKQCQRLAEANRKLRNKIKRLKT